MITAAAINLYELKFVTIGTRASSIITGVLILITQGSIIAMGYVLYHARKNKTLASKEFF
jgi:hypothetical protein